MTTATRLTALTDLPRLDTLTAGTEYREPSTDEPRARNAAAFGGADCQRFTRAHELGHWIRLCVDATEPREVFCCAETVAVDPEAKVVEPGANVFAAELLRPEPAARATGADAADEYAEHFGGSREAMRWRLHSFGLGQAP